MRTIVPQELFWAFLHDIDLSQPLSQQLNAWESVNRALEMDKLKVDSENPDRKRSASLIPYTEKEKRKAPRPDELQLKEAKKITLRQVYDCVKKKV
jgi:hypothetical protein